MKIAALLATLAVVSVLYARQQQEREIAQRAAAADAAAVLPGPGNPAASPAHSVYRRALDSASAVAEQARLQQAEQEKDAR